MNSKTDKGQAKNGKAQQKSKGGGGRGTSQQDKKKDVKQEKDPTTATLVTWVVPTHFQREPDAGENLAEATCGHQMLGDNLDSDLLTKEQVASQFLRISNIVTEGVLSDG